VLAKLRQATSAAVCALAVLENMLSRMVSQHFCSLMRLLLSENLS
jgi:hypothetical protein